MRQLQYSVEHHDVTICCTDEYIPVVFDKVLVVDENAQQAAQSALETNPSASIGYSVPFKNLADDQTSIKYVSPEMLIWEAMVDPKIMRYHTVIVNNAQDRVGWVDVVIAVLNLIIKARNGSLKLIIQTTNDSIAFLKSYFPDAPVVDTTERVENDVEYLVESTQNYLQSGIDTVRQICHREAMGTVGLIVSSNKEVKEAVSELEQLDAAIITDQTTRLDYNKRNIIVTTRLTIATDFVVDCGFVRVEWVDRGAVSYKTNPISKCQHQQRRQLANSKLFCMYTTLAASELEPVTPPQILGCDLTTIILRLLALGVNLSQFQFITTPSPDFIARALNRLRQLGAIDLEGNLVQAGRIMAEMPLSLPLARAISESASQGCLSEMLTIAAMSLTGGLETFLKQPRAQDNIKTLQGDHITLLNVYHSKSRDLVNHQAIQCATKIRRQLQAYTSRLGISPLHTPEACENRYPDQTVQKLQFCLARGFGFNLAKRKHQFYKLYGANHGQICQLHSSSVFQSIDLEMLDTPISPWVVYDQLVEANSQVYIKTVTVIDRAMLDPQLYKQSG